MADPAAPTTDDPPTEDPPTEERSDPEPGGYAEAMAELEAILAEIEDDAVDVDVLTRKVARAAHLIRWCRGRIDGARIDVERIVADIAPATPAAEAEEPAEADPS